jgi:hypothetical protein
MSNEAIDFGKAEISNLGTQRVPRIMEYLSAREEMIEFDNNDIISIAMKRFPIHPDTEHYFCSLEIIVLVFQNVINLRNQKIWIIY